MAIFNAFACVSRACMLRTLEHWHIGRRDQRILDNCKCWVVTCSHYDVPSAKIRHNDFLERQARMSMQWSGQQDTRYGCGSKLNHEGTAGFGPRCHLPGVPFWVPIFDPQPYQRCASTDESAMASCMQTPAGCRERRRA